MLLDLLDVCPILETLQILALNLGSSAGQILGHSVVRVPIIRDVSDITNRALSWLQALLI